VKNIDADHFAVAWSLYELGRYAEAQAALSKIPAKDQNCSDVLELRWRICAKRNQWGDCIDLARSMTLQDPDYASGWVHLAESVEKVAGGTVQMAYDILLRAARDIHEPVLLLELVRCSARLGNNREAQQWINEARQRGDLAQSHRDELAMHRPGADV